MVKVTLSVLDRPVVLVEECPKCGIPGLHKMPRRILVMRADADMVEFRRESYERTRRDHGSYWGGYGMYDWHQENVKRAREHYHEALTAARFYTYVLMRECYSCDHEWYELIDRFESDHRAALLRERYPEGLEVQASGLR